MSPTPFTLPNPNEYLLDRKLLSYLLLCHKLKVEFKSSFSIPEPIPYRIFLSGSRKYVQKIIEFELVDLGATMLDFFLKTGHKPVRLELRVPIAPKRKCLIPFDPLLRKKIEFLDYWGCSSNLTSDNIRSKGSYETYSVEETSYNLHLHFIHDPLDGCRVEYRHYLLQQLSIPKDLLGFYNPLIDLGAPIKHGSNYFIFSLTPLYYIKNRCRP